MVTETHSPDGHKTKGGPIANIVKFPAGSGQLAPKFIEPGKNFDEALSNTRIVGGVEGQLFLRNLVLLRSKMERFNKRNLFDNEIASLTSLLNGLRSIDGIGMNLAAATDTDIYYPQAGGLELSKEDKKALLEMNRMRHGSNRGRNNDNEDGYD